MEEEDGMVVIVVGDEDSNDRSELFSTTIKTEPLDESEFAPVEKILEVAVKHGELIEIKKEEEEYDEYEYLEEDQLEETAETADPDPDYSVSKSSRRRGRKKRIFAPRPDIENHKPVSYVQKLRDENPEFKKNPSKLIEHLAKMMRFLRPPKLPHNFCSVNVIKDTVTYICNTCNVELDSLGAAGRHYQRFHGERYLLCYACGIDFTNTTNLYKHEKRCTAKDAKIVLRARGKYLGVKGRGRPFTTKDRFKFGPDPIPKPRGRFYCSLCPASFSHKMNMLAHEYTHAGVRPYRCHLCGAAYTSGVALKRHLQTHSVGKYICDTCGRVFKFKPLLASHLNTHLPYRKYACDHCPKRFAQKTALRHHINTKHLKLPPEHICPACPKRFSRLSYVRSHMQRVHGLTMITRQKFFQALPTMSDTCLQEAKVILNSDLKPFINQNIVYEVKQVPIELQQKINNHQKSPKVNRKGIYQIKENGKKKVYEIPIDKEDDPETMDKFIKFIHSVKPGSEVVKVQKEVPKAQCLKSYYPNDIRPKVKMVYNNIDNDD